MNLAQVTRTFQTEEDCLEHLEKMRWPDGIRCPTCGGNEICKGTRKATKKNLRTRFYQCLEPTCKQQFSATNGTIFHRSHLPLSLWFMAINIITDAKKGISALQLQQHLGIGSYKTAWYMCHRIRKAMEDLNPTLMEGIVEVDETYIGGRVRLKGKIRSGKMTKEMVVGIKQRDGNLRLKHVSDLRSATVADIIHEHVSPAVEAVMTDEASIYPKAIIDGGIAREKHFSVNHGKGQFVKGIVSTNGIESAFSLLKRGIMGSFHRISVKHLHRYLTEFEYRFNARKQADRFNGALRAMLTTPAMSYAQLIYQPKLEEIL